MDQDAGPPPAESGMRGDVAAPTAWRLTFAYGPEGVRLAAQERVDMLAPADDSDLTRTGRAGYWVEVRGADGRALHRQVVHNPFRAVLEAHSPEPGSTPRHVRTSAATGAFQVVVPDLPGAHEVILHGLDAPGETPPAADAAAEKVASVAHPLLTEPLGETPPFEVS